MQKTCAATTLAMLCSFLSSAQAQVPLSNTRVEGAKHAEESFRQLHFFHKGRGMHLMPNLIEAVDKYRTFTQLPPVKSMIQDRWGFNLVNQEIVGIFSESYSGFKVGVLGCVGCHSGRAAGRFIVGLGNKNIDVYQIGADLVKVQSLYKTVLRGNFSGANQQAYQEITAQSMKFAERLIEPKDKNLTRGLVPVSIIRRWFYDNGRVPVPSDMGRGQVKVPSFWGYKLKREVGQFSDGFGNGVLPGWGAAVELVGGQLPEQVRDYQDKLSNAEDILGELLPPKYPFAIDSALAAKGKDVFVKTCQRCHGTYLRDADDLPIFEAPKWVAIQTVRTDDERLSGNSPGFLSLIDKNPLNDLIQTTQHGPGYIAPKLYGIWARFPYLHNASVPTLCDLLSPPEQRAEVFSLKDSGEEYRYDTTCVGLKNPVKNSLEERTLLARAKMQDRTVYWTSRTGHSSQGHSFGLQLLSADRRALIEYLKTL
ncbi:MAG: hypothetical protein K2X47_13815 [Bdellovibrionales bacterium]|nr:hypothetical protein [Bdellovibrionales bacterium]